LKKYYENVILITRGILEKQHRNRMSLKREKGRNMNYVGIDIGSTASKVVVEGDKKEHFVLPTGWSSKETCEKIKNKLLEMGVDVTSDDTKVVATGYGRIAVDFADHVITEITCHARGGRELAGGDCSIIDVGGQDTKVIIVQNGMVSDFQMNDKCSAGTGKFLEIMANRLGVTINELFDMAAAGEVIPISSLCTVFAESEVINYIGEGKKREDIAAGVVDSVANKVVQLAQKKELGDRAFISQESCQTSWIRKWNQKSLAVLRGHTGQHFLPEKKRIKGDNENGTD
jgi:predicted CoA-substrate-specific enzyme activase